MSEPAKKKIEVEGLSVRYAGVQALDNISLDVYEHEILSIIGPANAGKTTFLNCINRMIDSIPEARVEGTINIDGQNVRKTRDINALRRRIGMVFPLPVGLPMSIYDNVAFAPRMAGKRDKTQLDELVVTDTIPLSEAAQSVRKVRQLTIADLLAESIRRVSNEESISALFQ